MMDNLNENQWIEIGIVADEVSGIAARICIQHGQKYPLPSVQLGTLIGDEKMFSPFLHPTVVWQAGKGKVDVKKFGTIPSGLKRQIASLLKPHLVEKSPDAISELLNYTLIEMPEGSGVITSMNCLSCS